MKTVRDHVRTDVEVGTVDGMRSLESLFHTPAWLQINLDGTTTRIDAQLSRVIPSRQMPLAAEFCSRGPAELRSHFTRRDCLKESMLKLGIWSSYTLIFSQDSDSE